MDNIYCANVNQFFIINKSGKIESLLWLNKTFFVEGGFFTARRHNNDEIVPQCGPDSGNHHDDCVDNPYMSLKSGISIGFGDIEGHKFRNCWLNRKNDKKDKTKTLHPPNPPKKLYDCLWVLFSPLVTCLSPVTPLYCSQDNYTADTWQFPNKTGFRTIFKHLDCPKNNNAGFCTWPLSLTFRFILPHTCLLRSDHFSPRNLWYFSLFWDCKSRHPVQP